MRGVTKTVLGLVAVALVGCGSSAPAAPAHPTPEPHVITNADAVKVVQKWAAARDAAFASNADPKTMDALAEEPVLSAEKSLLTRTSVLKDNSFAILHLSKPTAHAVHSASFPSYFVATGKINLGGGADSTLDALFQKDTAGASWKLSHMVFIGRSDDIPILKIDSQGYIDRISGGDQPQLLQHNGGDVEQMYADYYTAGVTTGKPPSAVFAPGPLTDQLLALEYKNNTSDPNSPVKIQETMAPEVAVPTVAIALANGGAEVFGVERSTVVSKVANSDNYLIQDQTFNYGTILAPGHYSLVHQELVWNVVFVTPPKTSKALLSVVGNFTEAVSSTGVPSP